MKLNTPSILSLVAVKARVCEISSTDGSEIKYASHLGSLILVVRAVSVNELKYFSVEDASLNCKILILVE